MPESDLHVASDDLDLFIMSRLPDRADSIVQSHIESCHYCAIRAVEQARTIWRMRDTLRRDD
jgi:hypothetical protein